MKLIAQLMNIDMRKHLKRNQKELRHAQIFYDVMISFAQKFFYEQKLMT